MGKAKKQVLDDDDAVFAQRAVELKGAPPSRALTSPLPIKETTILGTTAGPRPSKDPRDRARAPPRRRPN